MDEQIAWGLIADFITGPLDWRRSDLKDARQVYMQAGDVSSNSIDDFLLWREKRPSLSVLEEKELVEIHKRMFSALGGETT